MIQKGQNQDVVLVGAGLSSCILAWYLARRRPELKLLLFEAGPSMAKQKTWSFHGQDVEAQRDELEPLIEKSWQGYDVRFPKYCRSLHGTYHSIRPAHLEIAIKKCLGERLRFNSPVQSLASDHVVLKDGTKINAKCVLDGRGSFAPTRTGYQKFVGLHVRLKAPHGLIRPLLMDAAVPQLDGYRFIYLLPWSEHEILIEDTRYSNSPVFDAGEMQTEIKSYAAKQSWIIDEVLEVESSALPIPIEKIPTHSALDQVPRIGMSGGFFHPVTGYSLPDAVRLAHIVSRIEEISSSAVVDELVKYSQSKKSQSSYFKILNTMMFLAAKPQERYLIFEHFYRLPESTISRFYRGELSITDRMRILSGRPPVPVVPAMKSLLNIGQGAKL